MILKFLLWCVLLILCWPLALLALVLYPIVWLLLLPFRLLGIAVHGALDLVAALIFLPARLLRAAEPAWRGTSAGRSQAYGRPSGRNRRQCCHCRSVASVGPPERAHLDRCPTGNHSLAAPLQCFIQISGFQHPEPAYELPGL